MKIAHISISDPFIDNWGYQINLLTRYLQEIDVQNYIVASANDFPSYLEKETRMEIEAKGNEYDLNGIKVRRIPTKKLSTTMVVTWGLRDVLEDIKPDVIFHHNFNCTSMPICARYAKRHCIPMVVDNHADTINMSKNRLWSFIYYKLLIGVSVKLHQKQIFKAYGVTHSRCDFIRDFYGVREDRIDFLPIGADVDFADTIKAKNELRRKYNIDETAYVVVSGGKMGVGKGTDSLIRAVESLKNDYPQLVLVLFGRFEDTETKMMAHDSHVTIVHGWCDRTKTLELLKLADVACWPIHHTTLIEDAVSVCTPVINRKTGTSEHLIDGNGVWVEDGSVASLRNALLAFVNMDEEMRQSLSEASEKMRDRISYHTVVKKMLDDIKTYNIS